MEIYAVSILVTIFTSLFTFYLAFNVWMTRQKHKSMPWENTIDKEVMIANRVHMNTIEATVVYLPLLWVATVFWSSTIAWVFGLIWFISRVWYAFAYLKNPKKRQTPFMIWFAMIAFTGLLGMYWILA